MTALEEKVRAIAEMVRETGPGPWNHFSCMEIEPIEDLLRFAGYDEEADFIVADHAAGDDQIGDEHHDLFLSLADR